MKHFLAIVLFGLGACSNDGGGGSGGGDVTASGSVTPAAAGNTIVFWVSDSGSGDYAYKYGEGTSAGSTFTVGFDEPVPVAATFSGVFGVGQVGLFPSDVTFPNGIIDDSSSSAFSTKVIGFAGNYAFIFKGTGDTSQVPWLAAFPPGVSCGVCVHDSGGFDSFAPVSCDAMELDTGDVSTIAGCNWT